jgi:hypothetical protein
MILQQRTEQRSASAVARQNGLSPRRIWTFWFSLSSVLNLYLLYLAFRRWHYALPSTIHEMAQMFFAAVAVNVGSELLIGWFALHEQWQNRLSTVLKLDAVVSLVPFAMERFFLVQDTLRFRVFGTLYTLFLLLRLVVAFAWAASNLSATDYVRRSSLYVFLTTTLIFAGFVPWIWLTNAPPGDEPAYLLLAHSLAFDHDFDVGDNYRNRDYAEQFPPPSPGELLGYPFANMERDTISYLPHEPHVIVTYRGQEMLWHDVGLPILIAPAYYFGKREGALFVMALLGGLGAAAIFEIAALLGATNLQALITSAIFCFTSPYYIYVQAVLVEIPGAVGILWVALQFFRYRERARNRYLLLAGIVIAALPWLIVRFWALAGPLFLVLNAWVILRSWGRWHKLIFQITLLGAPSLVGLLLFALMDKRFFDSYLPNAANLIWNHISPQFGGRPILGFFGLLFDQSFGLLPTAPLFVAAIAGMIVVYKRDRWAFAALFLPIAGYLPFVARSRYWMGGWAPPARLLVAAAMLMAPAAALVMTRKTRWITIALTSWGALLTLAYTVVPYLRSGSVWHMYNASMLVEVLHSIVRTRMYSIMSIFPNCIKAERSDWLRAWAWLAIVAVSAWLWAKSTAPHQSSVGQKRIRS